MADKQRNPTGPINDFLDTVETARLQIGCAPVYIENVDKHIRGIRSWQEWSQHNTIPGHEYELDPRLEETIDAYKERRARYLVELKTAMEQVEKVAAFIDKVTPDRRRELLHLHYIEGKKWDEVADILNYSQSSIFGLRRRALLAAQELYDEEVQRNEL